MSETNNKEVLKVEESNESWETILNNESCYAPLVDIYETNDEFVLSADMPGVNKEDVNLKIEDGSMLLFGKINYRDALNRRYLLQEKEIGHFFRKFKISDTIDESKISAQFENGQLIVILPKHERIKPRTINIK
ncbi:MAG TPA: Hsp20/alpha crystallin family protein [Ignavibacteriaceae bacterium]|nr:Hsp20/alpha crystallin family protein [Ignavibacteriaceae bacterium]